MPVIMTRPVNAPRIATAIESKTKPGSYENTMTTLVARTLSDMRVPVLSSPITELHMHSHHDGKCSGDNCLFTKGKKSDIFAKHWILL
jgi:hypothetical protein